MSGDGFERLDEIDIEKFEQACDELAEMLRRALKPAFEAAQQFVETLIETVHRTMDDEPGFAEWAKVTMPSVYEAWAVDKARQRSRDDLVEKRRMRHKLPPNAR